MTLTNNYGLSNDEIVRYAPSVGATHAHSSVSERYMDIPTLDVINALRDLNFVPTSVMQSASRLPDGNLYTKHILRLRQAEFLGDRRRVGDEVPEILITNSRGSVKSAYAVMAAIFRLVCSNGLVVRSAEFGEIRVLHRGRQVERVVDATRTIASHADEVMRVVDEMKRIELSPAERNLFADFADRVRYGNPEPQTVDGELVSVEAIQRNPGVLLLPREREDRGKTDLYTTLNVVQQNLMQGGRHIRGNRRAQPIKSVDKTIKDNQLVWQFAEELRKIHSN